MNVRNQAVHSTVVRRAMMAVDIVAFGDPSRDDSVQAHLRASLYKVLRETFSVSGVPWDQCFCVDRGDGIFVVIPPEVPTVLLVDPMLLVLAESIRRHNRTSSEPAHIRLRVSVHAGFVTADKYGLAGHAIVHTFRLLDAPSFKKELNRSGRDIGLIVSDYFYDSVVRHGLSMLDPEDFRPTRVQVKETQSRGWIYIPGGSTDFSSTSAPEDQRGIRRSQQRPS